MLLKLAVAVSGSLRIAQDCLLSRSFLGLACCQADKNDKIEFKGFATGEGGWVYLGLFASGSIQEAKSQRRVVLLHPRLSGRREQEMD